MSNRGADRKTQVNYVTIGRMAEGYVPEMESVVKFAQGFGLDVNEWLELAGYERVEDPAMKQALDAVSVLMRGLRELQAEFPGQVVPIPRFPGDARSLTLEQVRSVLDDIRRRLAASEPCHFEDHAVTGALFMPPARVEQER